MDMFEYHGPLEHRDSYEDFRKCSEDDKLVVTLVSSSIDKWGASINFDDDWSQWKVQTVDQGLQLARKGVDSGFRIRAVDGKLLNAETQWTVRVFLTEGLGCEIEFDTSQRSSLFQPHETQQWRKSSIAREESAMAEEMSRLVRSQSNYLFTKERSEILRKEASVSDNNKKKFLSSNSINGLYQNLGCDEKKDREDDDIFETSPLRPKENEDLESVKIGLKLVWNEINKLKECYNGLSGVVGRMNARLSNVESKLQMKISKIEEAEHTLNLCSEKVAQSNMINSREMVSV